jgi:PAS domain S-box-containing protein
MQSNKKEEQAIERFIGLSKQNHSENDASCSKVPAREDKFHLLVSNIPDALWKIDRNNYIIYISENIEAITGYTPEEEYKMGPYLNWINRVHPDDVKEYVAAIDALFEKDRPFNIEYGLRRKDGEWVWIHDRAVVTYDEDGKKYASGMLSDITERKRAELHVKELKEKYEALIRNIPDAIYSGLPDETCTMTFISDRYRDWTGYSPQDFYQDPWAWPKTVHPEDRERELKTYIESCQKKQAYLSEYRIVHKDTGQVRWVRDHGVPVTDEKRNLVLFDGTITDITERKQAELHVKELKEKYEALIRNIPDAMYSSLPDEKATALFVSDRYKDWTGYSPQDFYEDPETWLKSIHPEDRENATKAYIAAYKKKKEFICEYRVVHKNTGQVRWLREHGMPIKDGKDNIIRYDGILTDITEQKRLREDLEFYIREITIAQEQERKRISRELHDETAQSLADLYTDVDMTIMKEQLSEKVVRRLEQLRLKIDSMLEEVRRQYAGRGAPLQPRVTAGAFRPVRTDTIARIPDRGCEYRGKAKLPS